MLVLLYIAVKRLQLHGIVFTLIIGTSIGEAGFDHFCVNVMYLLLFVIVHSQVFNSVSNFV